MSKRDNCVRIKSKRCGSTDLIMQRGNFIRQSIDRIVYADVVTRGAVMRGSLYM